MVCPAPFRVVITILLLAITGFSCPAFGQVQQITGQWKNDQTGTVFFITPEHNGAFAIIRSRRKEKKKSLRAIRATWVRGMRGSQFRFGKATGTIAHDAKTIRFPKYTWSKTAEYPGPGQQAGFWSSSSGNVFLVTSDIAGIFHVLNFTKLGRFVSRAAWVEGMNGVQYEYKRGEIVVTLAKDNRTARLLNRKTSKNFTWTRVAEWPAGSKP